VVTKHKWLRKLSFPDNGAIW